MLSSSLAASDIMSGSHGGSQVTSTLAEVTPSTAATFSSTSGGRLSATGHIGDVRELYVWAPHGHSGGSPTPVLPVPDGFDYDLWLGPAPKTPFCKDRSLNGGARNGIFHIYDYAIGFMAGWGAHPMDMLQWWADNAGMKTIPVRYEGTGTLPKEGLFDTLTNWDVMCTMSSADCFRAVTSSCDIHASGRSLRIMSGYAMSGVTRFPKSCEMCDRMAHMDA